MVPLLFNTTGTKFTFADLRSQIATSNSDDGAGGRRYLPFAYTEQGISMLSAVLRSDQAIAVVYTK